MDAITIAMTMSVILLTLGIILVNRATGPVVAQGGALLAGAGLALLAALAAAKLVFWMAAAPEHASARSPPQHLAIAEEAAGGAIVRNERRPDHAGGVCERDRFVNAEGFDLRQDAGRRPALCLHRWPFRPMEIIMKKITSLRSCIMALAFLALPAAPAFADATVNVSLLDKGGAMDLSKNMMMGMGMKGGMKMAPMSIRIDKKTVPAGKVTFRVKNASKETIHEMLVAPVASETAVLPFIDSENRVDEEKMADLGEVSELDPGKSGALTVTMKPGLYILYCNVPGHYTAGMWTVLKVK